MNRFKLNLCRACVLLASFYGVQEVAAKAPKNIQREKIQLSGMWHSTLGDCRLPGIPSKLLDARYGQADDKQIIYHRALSVPATLAGKRLRLVIERTDESTLWVDGDSIGHFSHPCLPHIYDLPPVAGKRTEFSVKASGGIYGDIYLEACDSTYIADMSVLPDIDAKSVDVRLSIESPRDSRVYLRLSTEAVGKDQGQPAAQYELAIRKGRNELNYRLSLGDSVNLWSEFHPDLYRVEARLSSGAHSDIMDLVFGINTKEFKDSGLYVNGKSVFLRGRDYSDIRSMEGIKDDDRWKMKVWWWREVFSKGKQDGINFWKMGDYCAPEAAFSAADIEGVYISSVETSIGEGHPSFLVPSEEYQEMVPVEEQSNVQDAGQAVQYPAAVSALYPVVSFEKTMLKSDEKLNVEVSVTNYTEETWNGPVRWTLVADDLKPVTKETLPSFKGSIDCTVAQGGTSRAGRVYLPLSLLGLRQGETCRLTLTIIVGDAEYPYVFTVGDQPVFN